VRGELLFVPLSPINLFLFVHLLIFNKLDYSKIVYLFFSENDFHYLEELIFAVNEATCRDFISNDGPIDVLERDFFDFGRQIFED
jgi:hypothetical protein